MASPWPRRNFTQTHSQTNSHALSIHSLNSFVHLLLLLLLVHVSAFSEGGLPGESSGAPSRAAHDLEQALSSLISTSNSVLAPDRRLSSVQLAALGSYLISTLSQRTHPPPSKASSAPRSTRSTGSRDESLFARRVLASSQRRPTVLFLGCPAEPLKWEHLLNLLGAEPVFILPASSSALDLELCVSRGARLNSLHRNLFRETQYFAAPASLTRQTESLSTLPPHPFYTAAERSSSTPATAPPSLRPVAVIALPFTEFLPSATAPCPSDSSAPADTDSAPAACATTSEGTLSPAIAWLFRTLLSAAGRRESRSQGKDAAVPLFLPTDLVRRVQSAMSPHLVRVGLLPHPLTSEADLDYLLALAPASAHGSLASSSPLLLPDSHASWSSTTPDNVGIIAITPTYARPEQRAMLSTTAAQLRGAGLVLWIVVEDADAPIESNRRFLQSTGIPFIYLAQRKNPGSHHRGVAQRNRALDEIEKRRLRGVVIFLDDDNTVDQHHFAWIHSTTHVNLCTVGLIPYQADVACADIVLPDEHGYLAAVWSSWNNARPFPIDMLGIALHTDVLTRSRARFSEASAGGMLESDLLVAVVRGAHLTHEHVRACSAS
eukprot:CAMPEP_0174234804 /NCGR_PEP_ID=MMETSP0417-20130205/4450_1 /TAXON_ID=242541 /ORGANISM="Mayorella sp, Strain BSH-02190019" /LENGTH=604 /DNA_ID=CAMNT_0015313219 /DNA_START=43 /DNA_END=1853 /DNA_ORIENTATION=+